MRLRFERFQAASPPRGPLDARKRPQALDASPAPAELSAAGAFFCPAVVCRITARRERVGETDLAADQRFLLGGYLAPVESGFPPGLFFDRALTVRVLRVQKLVASD